MDEFVKLVSYSSLLSTLLDPYKALQYCIFSILDPSLLRAPFSKRKYGFNPSLNKDQP